MKFELPELKYPEDGLSPYISKETVQYHYGKHTKKYYETVNKLVADTTFDKFKSLQELIENGLVRADTKLHNNACQAWNHTFYWDSLCPSKDDNEPTGELLKQINSQFGSFEQFKKKFTESATDQFGSGWCWLFLQGKDLKIKSTPNAGTPITEKGKIPLLCVDVWEHAYYLDNPADRGTYLKDWWNIVDWDVVSERFEG